MNSPKLVECFMHVLSLFSGIGGFDRAFESAAAEIIQQVEIDEACNRVLARHWPAVPRVRDVRDVGRVECDVICGGFPCQDLSVAGKRAGLAGERSGLWFEFLRIVRLNTPSWVCIENVPGLLSSNEGRDFAVILQGLVECGYGICWRIFDSQFDGVAQRRRRLFIVASLGDGRSAQVLFESESVPWSPPTRGEAGQEVAKSLRSRSSVGSNAPGRGGEDDFNLAIPIQEVGSREKSQGGMGIGNNGDPMYTLQAGQIHGVAHTLNARGGIGRIDYESETFVTHPLRSEGADASEDGTGRGTPLVAKPLKSGGNLRHDESHDTYVCAAQFVNCFNGYTGGADDNDAQGNHLVAFMAGAGSKAGTVAASEDVSPTLKGSQSGSNRSPSIAGDFGVRRLTPTECERLQGFPDSWTEFDADDNQISDSARYRMLGNAVTVPVVTWIAKRIVACVGLGENNVALTKVLPA